MLKSVEIVRNYSNIMKWKVGTRQSSNEDASSEMGIDFLWESSLMIFSCGERMVFLTLFSVVTAIAVIGNLLTLYVVFFR